MSKDKEKVDDPYANVDTWKIMFDLYMYMKNRDWVEVVEEEREREMLQRKSYSLSQNAKQKDCNFEKNFRTPKCNYQTPTTSFNNKKREKLSKCSRKQYNTVKNKSKIEFKTHINQRPELTANFAETANKNS
uniref:Uncharacterized protein n=1 Tax=Strongyloides stercoralis TaxID=6248 RepID=A0AAF5CQP8_STRER